MEDKSNHMMDIVSAHPFFTGLNRDHLETVLGCVSNVKFEEGDLIHKTGDECNQFYLLRHGSVSIEIFSPGRGSLQLQTVGEGEVLGWSWMVAPFKWKFDARALTLVRAFAVDGKCLRGKAERDPALGYELMKRVAAVFTDRLEATRLQLLDLYGVHT